MYRLNEKKETSSHCYIKVMKMIEYSFCIADITIQIKSEIEIAWNDYICAFLKEPKQHYDETYECICADHLSPKGDLIYQDGFQQIFKQKDNSEERLHFFIGQKEPCMLYEENTNKKTIYLNKKYIESFLRKNNYNIFNALAFEKVLIEHRSVVLHSSFIIWNGQAILFTAPSGTGKSTQAALWEQHRGAVIANGDRTILKMTDKQVYAYGMPICGSSDRCLNVKAPVRAIVYLAQSPKNYIEDMETKLKIKKLISESTINFFNRNFLLSAMDIINEMAENVNMYFFHCTKEESAVDVLENRLRGEIPHGSDKSSELN